MTKALLPVIAAASLLTGCATDSYGHSSVEGRTTAGVLVGGVLGALAGNAAGLDPVSGAAIGMVVGGTAGYLVKGPVLHGRQYYKDSRGYCYSISPSGQPTYEPSVAC